MRKVIIFGATSAIAKAVARLMAEQGDHLCLVGRDHLHLETIENDLRVRGAASVCVVQGDLNQSQKHGEILEQAKQRMNGLDTVLVAHGALPDQELCQQSYQQTLEALNTNGLSYISILTEAANRLALQGYGCIAVITSVAGDRGRKSNYVYGAAKALVSTYLEGLRHRFHGTDIQVLTIKPGFVDTPMTAEFDKGMLWASAEQVGAGILKAIEQGKEVVYLPGFWRWIMLIIIHLPRALFKRINF